MKPTAQAAGGAAIAQHSAGGFTMYIPLIVVIILVVIAIAYFT
jgi:hypothetical protein